MGEIKGLISGIKRMEIHDGEGLRTTVFFKGCPFKCVWCHNPESIGYGKQTAFFKGKCIGCGSCLQVCRNGAVLYGGGIDHGTCIACHACTEVCPTEALFPYGKEYTPSELAYALLEDEPFFKNGKGGVTFSGGECLSQPDLAAETARLLQERGISVFVDTCGYVKKEVLDRITPYTDKFLYDIKTYSEQTHINCTGRSNEIILDNLKYLSALGARIEVRIPYVPELNGSEMNDIGRFLSGVNIEKIKVLPYHSHAVSRYEALGMTTEMPQEMPSDEETESVRRIMRKYCPLVTVE